MSDARPLRMNQTLKALKPGVPRMRRGRPTKASDHAALQQAVRLALVTEALRLFDAHGYDGVTVTDVARRAGVSPRTFFRYFKSKDDLLFSWVYDMGDMVSEHLLPPAPRSTTPAKALQRGLLAFAQRFDNDRWHLRPLVAVIYAHPGLQGRHAIEAAKWSMRWAEELHSVYGTPTSDALAHLGTTAALIAVVNVATQRWCSAGFEGRLADLVAGAFADLERSLA